MFILSCSVNGFSWFVFLLVFYFWCKGSESLFIKNSYQAHILKGIIPCKDAVRVPKKLKMRRPEWITKSHGIATEDVSLNISTVNPLNGRPEKSDILLYLGPMF